MTDLKHQPNRGAIVFTKNADGDAVLACGRMYVVINNNGVEFDVYGLFQVPMVLIWVELTLQ